MTAFTDGKSLFFLQSYRRDKLYGELNSISRHHHFHALTQGHLAGDVGSADVKLRLVAIKDRSVASAFLFTQDINLARRSGRAADFRAC